jgi:tetratricopeptide (TPR) repeat protein
MRTRRIAALVLVAFTTAIVPTTFTRTVAAQADDPVTTQARARFKEGVEFYDKGKYEEARLAFLQAYTLKKHPAVLLNLAQSSAKAGHPMEAAKYFKQFLKESTTASPQQKKDAETGLADVRQKLGRIEVVAPSGTEITLDDGERIGTTPLSEPLDVEPGPHTVKSPTESVKVIATVGQKVEAKFGAASSSGTAVAPVPSPSSGSDDPTAANAPPSAGNDGSSAANPPANGDTGAKKTNLLTPPDNMIPVYAGLAIGVGAAVSAIVFAAFKADAQSKADAVANDIRRAASLRGISSQGVCSSSNAQIQRDFGNACKTLRDNNDKVDTNATIANISIVVSAVGFATAFGWFLFAPKGDDAKSGDTIKRIPERKAQTPILTPYGGWNSAGLTLSGEF